MSNQEIVSANQYCELVEGANIESHSKLKVAVQSVAAIKNQLNGVTEKNKKAIDPIKQKLVEIQAKLKPAIDAYSKAEKLLKKKIADYVGGCYVKRDNSLRLPSPTPEDIQKAQDCIPPIIPGLSVSKKLVIVIEDPNKVVQWAYEYASEELIQPNEKAIQRYVVEHGLGTKIDGVKVEEKRTVSITVSKVDMG